MTLLLNAEFVNFKAFFKQQQTSSKSILYLSPQLRFTIERQFVPLFEIIINLSWTRQTKVLALCVYVFGWTVPVVRFNKLDNAWASFVTFLLTIIIRFMILFYYTIITFSVCYGKKHSEQREWMLIWRMLIFRLMCLLQIHSHSI